MLHVVDDPTEYTARIGRNRVGNGKRQARADKGRAAIVREQQQQIPLASTVSSAIPSESPAATITPSISTATSTPSISPRRREAPERTPLASTIASAVTAPSATTTGGTVVPAASTQGSAASSRKRKASERLEAPTAVRRRTDEAPAALHPYVVEAPATVNPLINEARAAASPRIGDTQAAMSPRVVGADANTRQSPCEQRTHAVSVSEGDGAHSPSTQEMVDGIAAFLAAD